MNSEGDQDAAAQELDGPGAIVSHAEALQAWRDGCRDGSTVAHALGVSYSTGRRLLRNLRRAGLLDHPVR